jgi:hypothetical protein
MLLLEREGKAVPGSRWDHFADGELLSLAESIEAAYQSDGLGDPPLWSELLAVMDTRDIGTAELRDEMRDSLGAASRPRRPLSQRIKLVDAPSSCSMRKGT